MNDYTDALARAAAYTDAVGLSDGTDRPAASLAELAELELEEPVGPSAEQQADADYDYLTRGG